MQSMCSAWDLLKHGRRSDQSPCPADASRLAHRVRWREKREGGERRRSREEGPGESRATEESLWLASASESTCGGQLPDSSPRGGQKPLSSTMTASNCHTARGRSELSSSTVPCNQSTAVFSCRR